YRMSEGEFDASMERAGAQDIGHGLRSRVWMAAGDYSVRQLKTLDARRHYRCAAEQEPAPAGLRWRQWFLKTGTLGMELVGVLRTVKRSMRPRVRGLRSA